MRARVAVFYSRIYSGREPFQTRCRTGFTMPCFHMLGLHAAFHNVSSFLWVWWHCATHFTWVNLMPYIRFDGFSASLAFVFGPQSKMIDLLADTLSSPGIRLYRPSLLVNETPALKFTHRRFWVPPGILPSDAAGQLGGSPIRYQRFWARASEQKGRPAFP